MNYTLHRKADVVINNPGDGRKKLYVVCHASLVYNVVYVIASIALVKFAKIKSKLLD